MSRSPFLLALLLAFPAQAQHGDDAEFDQVQHEPRRITPGAAITSGALRVTRGAELFELPLLHTTVDTWISGLVAEVDVTQTYSNPFDEPIEATYLFPLPDDSAVHEMVMQVGDRRIEGTIKRRAEAEELYRQARDNGQTAALLNQERPNVFTQRVANILPGESIEVTIAFAQVLDYADGAYEWVMPLVVGPRYVPAEGTGTRGNDAAAINPLMSEGPTGNTVDVRVELDAGMPIQSLRSPSHAIHVIEEGDTGAFVELDGDDVPNKDFILRYELSGSRPEAAALSSWGDQGGHFLLMIQPPTDDQLAGMITPKDLVFLVDTSCSQSGAPMDAAKQAMNYAIDGLNPGDSWKIMSFSSSVGPAIQGGSSAADQARAREFVEGFRGAGGTNMLAGVQAALDLREQDALRTVLMITDGYVGNETRILGAIEENLGRNRFFTLGTGSSVNRYLIDRAAKVGRGTVQVIRPDEDAQEAVETFYNRIRNPLLTDIEIASRGVELLDVQPDPIADLFSGQPVVLVGRYEQAGPAEITIRGRLGNKPWKKTVKVDLRGEGGNPALGSLWARRWIEDLESRQHWGCAFDDRDEFEEEVTNLALQYSLMSQYTSFVAVEETVVNEDGRPRTVEVPVETPEFVEFEAVADEEDEDEPYLLHRRTSRYNSYSQSAPTRSMPAQPSPSPKARPAPTLAPAATGARPSTSSDIAGGVHGGLSGLGTRGQGKGGGGYGRGSASADLGGGYYGKKAEPELRASIGRTDAIILGSMDKSSIDRVIKQSLNRIKYCYEKQLRTDPTLAGRVVIKFVIQADGTVSTTEITESTVGDETLESCIQAQFKRMTFAKPQGGGIVVVSYPLVFNQNP